VEERGEEEGQDWREGGEVVFVCVCEGEGGL